jgi:hypothetical protein
MAVSDHHGAESEGQADVDACLTETGVTMDQVRRWRHEGLLPVDVEQQWPEPYHGSETRYPIGTCAQIRATQSLFREKNRKDFVGLRLWRLGFAVSEDNWRPQLRHFARLADRVVPFVLRLRSRVDRNEEGDTLQEKAARHLPSSIILSRVMGRLGGEDLAIFYRVILELGLGEFESFDAPGGDEIRSRDKTATIKALDIGNAERHEILGNKLNFINVLPSALENAAKAFKIGSFAAAAEAPAEEIAKARDDARNALQIGFCLYEALKWVYGPGAFGLRLFAWFARRAPDALINGLILSMLRLREIPNAILPSEQIAKMAKDARGVWNASQRLEWLWRNDPRFSEVLSPKRMKAAFANEIALKCWQEEIRRASMRQSDEILKDRLP